MGEIDYLRRTGQSSKTMSFDEAHITELARWRGCLRATCYLLRDQGAIGLYNGNWALPNKDVDGDIRSIHFRVAPKTAGEKARWFHEPKGAKVHALVFGELAKAGAIAIFESQWDAITLFDKLNFNPFACHDWAFVSTRGAANAKALKELDIPVSAELYLFPQSDAAGTRWTDDRA